MTAEETIEMVDKLHDILPDDDGDAITILVVTLAEIADGIGWKEENVVRVVSKLMRSFDELREK